jgi:hypothetical protein
MKHERASLTLILTLKLNNNNNNNEENIFKNDIIY